MHLPSFTAIRPTVVEIFLFGESLRVIEISLLGTINVRIKNVVPIRPVDVDVFHRMCEHFNQPVLQGVRGISNAGSVHPLGTENVRGNEFVQVQQFWAFFFSPDQSRRRSTDQQTDSDVLSESPRG